MSARVLLFAIAATGLALAAAGPATAQTYPDRPIKLISQAPIWAALVKAAGLKIE